MRPDDDHPREACGVFGVYAPGLEVSRLAFFALYALQHRGQESAGIATCDGSTARVHKDMGLVTQVFNEDNLAPLQGHMAVGHTRYSTSGSPHRRNAQPYLIETMHGPLGVAHNGNLTGAHGLRRALLERGVGLTSSSDTEVIVQMLAAQPPGGDSGEPAWEARIASFMQAADAAYSLVILTRDALFGVRDPLGMRPLCIGEVLGEGGEVSGYALASESCALATIGARYLREVEPGEIVRLDADGLTATAGREPLRRSLCVFEYIYFARPDSVLDEQSIHTVRQRLGAELARESPVEADVVLGVPDSATPAAIGYAKASGIPYTEGLTKNRYIGRTFIQPTTSLRSSSVKLKYNPLIQNLVGQRVVLIDDSIVRGNTAGPLVQLMRDAGAREVHVRVSSPPVRHPCFMGVDMATYEELIAYNKDVDAICEHIGADSLAFLSAEGMRLAVEAGIRGPSGHCAACFTGNYPLKLDDGRGEHRAAKDAFES